MKAALQMCNRMCMIPLSSIVDWGHAIQKTPAFIATLLFGDCNMSEDEKVGQLKTIVKVSFDTVVCCYLVF